MMSDTEPASASDRQRQAGPSSAQRSDIVAGFDMLGRGRTIGFSMSPGANLTSQSLSPFSALASSAWSSSRCSSSASCFECGAGRPVVSPSPGADEPNGPVAPL